MKLEVGKYYKNRKGEVVKIVKYEEDEDFYRCKYRTYTPQGSYYTIGLSPYDLIEEVFPTLAVRVLEVQTNTEDWAVGMNKTKGKVYTEFRRLAYKKRGVGIKDYSYFPDQVEEGIICPITGEFIAMKNELSVEKKQEVTKVEYGVVYVVKTEGSAFEVGEKVLLQHDDGTDLPYFESVDGRIARSPVRLTRLEVYAPPKSKLKLEVGKKYRMRNGHITSELQSVDSSIYPFTVGGNTYTKDGMEFRNGDESQYDLIEEVVETKQETKEMKYYRVTKKNKEAASDIAVGTIFVLHRDDGTQMPQYKDVNSDRKQYLYTDRLEEINVKITTLVKGPASRMIKQLEDDGWVLVIDEDVPYWCKPRNRTFRGGMLQYCGKPKPTEWNWNDEWLETKYEFESLVKPKPSLNHRQFLIDFMRKKQELSYPSYLYTGDINEMKNGWSDEDCERVASDIINEDEWGFSSDTCPFCIYNHNVNILEEKCEECSYGKRHGICGNTGSDYFDEVAPNRKSGYRGELKTFVTNYPGVNKK